MKALYVALIAGLFGAQAAWADPPSHAPAHGYHKKHHHDDDDGHHHKHKYKKHKHKEYRGHSGVVYHDDYGIASGRCNRDAIGAVIGGVSGAVIGGQVADRDDRVVGMVIGGVVGAVIGHAVGERMDERDRACMGHALDLGKPGVPVVWRNGSTRYNFVPGDSAGQGCRHVTLRVDGGKPHPSVACPSGRGEWTFRRS